jgi:DNA gyrase subunit B
MFVGDVESGQALSQIIEEVLANSVDEHLAGYCTEINVTLHKDGSLTIEDNGRGIPVDLHASENKSSLEVVMTQLHAGGKFDNDAYAFSAGLHGVGVTATNALSEWLKVEVRRDDKVWFQEYDRGNPKSKVKAIGQCSC